MRNSVKNNFDPATWMMLLGRIDPSSTASHQQNRGIQQLLESDVFPTHADFAGEKIDRLLFERVGFNFAAEILSDPLFVMGSLPEGWFKEDDSNHDYHVFLKDALGRHRGSIFYKAQMYDRKASIKLVPRIQFEDRTDEAGHHYCEAMDGSTVLFRSKPHAEWHLGIYTEAMNLVNTCFPDFLDPEAYWDVDDLRVFIK